jgi:hypothetical protein
VGGPAAQDTPPSGTPRPTFPLATPGLAPSTPAASPIPPAVPAPPGGETTVIPPRPPTETTAPVTTPPGEVAVPSSPPEEARDETPDESIPSGGAEPEVADLPPDAALPTDDRPFRGPLESALRNPVLAIAPVVVLVGIAAIIGVTRDPTYTAESRVNVGRVDVPASTLQGVIIGNATLASGYARTIDAEPVAGPAGNAVGLSPSEARDRISASAIPDTTLIRVEAEGPSQVDAVRLSNAGSRSLINYVEDLNRQQQTAGLLRRFRAARARVERAKAVLDGLASAPRPSPARLEEARLDLASAQLQAETVGDQYRAVQTGPDAQNLLQFIAPAAEASSDRRSTFEDLVLIGLAAGILVGLSLALLRENSHLVGRR